MKKNYSLFDIITKTVMWVLGIIAIYMIILYLIGKSPSVEQIYVIIMGIMGTGLANLYYKSGFFEGKIGEFIDITKNSFKGAKEGMKKVKNDITNIKGDTNNIKKDISYIKDNLGDVKSNIKEINKR